MTDDLSSMETGLWPSQEQDDEGKPIYPRSFKFGLVPLTTREGAAIFLSPTTVTAIESNPDAPFTWLRTGSFTKAVIQTTDEIFDVFDLFDRYIKELREEQMRALGEGPVRVHNVADLETCEDCGAIVDGKVPFTSNPHTMGCSNYTQWDEENLI